MSVFIACVKFTIRFKLITHSCQSPVNHTIDKIYTCTVYCDCVHDSDFSVVTEDVAFDHK